VTRRVPVPAFDRVVMKSPIRHEPCSTCGADRAFVDGQAIRAKRLALKVTLRGLARAMCWSAPYQHDLEMNKRPLTLEKAARIVAAMERLA
jgi:hypothetical protein